jgi:hypothetical protein
MKWLERNMYEERVNISDIISHLFLQEIGKVVLERLKNQLTSYTKEEISKVINNLRDETINEIRNFKSYLDLRNPFQVSIEEIKEWESVLDYLSHKLFVVYLVEEVSNSGIEALKNLFSILENPSEYNIKKFYESLSENGKEIIRRAARYIGGHTFEKISRTFGKEYTPSTKFYIALRSTLDDITNKGKEEVNKIYENLRKGNVESAIQSLLNLAKYTSDKISSLAEKEIIYKPALEELDSIANRLDVFKRLYDLRLHTQSATYRKYLIFITLLGGFFFLLIFQKSFETGLFIFYPNFNFIFLFFFLFVSILLLIKYKLR